MSNCNLKIIKITLKEIEVKYNKKCLICILQRLFIITFKFRNNKYNTYLHVKYIIHLHLVGRNKNASHKR